MNLQPENTEPELDLVGGSARYNLPAVNIRFLIEPHYDRLNRNNPFWVIEYQFVSEIDGVKTVRQPLGLEQYASNKSAREALKKFLLLVKHEMDNFSVEQILEGAK